MSRILQRFAIFALVLGLIYLIAAFISWEWNPGNWKVLARSLAGLMGPLIALIATFQDEIV